MEIEEAIRAYLLTKTAITNLISTRIYTDQLEGALPAIVYQKVSDVKDHTLTGQSELESPVFQLSAYATTKNAARTLSNAIKTALQDYTGTLSGIEIQWIELLNEFSTVEQTPEKAYVEDLEYQIFFVKE